MRTRDHDSEQPPFDPDPVVLPRLPLRPIEPTGGLAPAFGLACLPQSAKDVYRAVESMSRRIDDLARELNCFGYFDDDDSPRAA